MILYLILVTVSLFIGTHCCSCKKPNGTDAYCKADFVAHVHFMNITSNLTDEFQPTSYKVDYVKVYRKTASFEAVQNPNVIVTPPQAACGVMVDMEAKNGKNWVIFGVISKDEPFINVCWPNGLWTKEIKDRLEKGDYANTKCSEVVKDKHPTTEAPIEEDLGTTEPPVVEKHQTTRKPKSKPKV